MKPTSQSRMARQSQMRLRFLVGASRLSPIMSTVASKRKTACRDLGDPKYIGSSRRYDETMMYDMQDDYEHDE